MDLMCTEKITQDSCYAMKDLNVLEDERVLRDLLELEEIYVPSCDYFKGFQSDVEPFMRKIVTKWMLEVRNVFDFMRWREKIFMCQNMRVSNTHRRSFTGNCIFGDTLTSFITYRWFDVKCRFIKCRYRQPRVLYFRDFKFSSVCTIYSIDSGELWLLQHVKRCSHHAIVRRTFNMLSFLSVLCCDCFLHESLLTYERSVRI